MEVHPVKLFRFERRNEPLLPPRQFATRMRNHLGFAGGILAFSLGIGVVGYHFFENLPWIDALLNASMILGGMGPVDPIRTTGGKLFASFYSLFSGVLFLVVVGIIVAPFVHRLLHRMHLGMDENDQDEE
jgi:hypothetical protein